MTRGVRVTFVAVAVLALCGCASRSEVTGHTRPVTVTQSSGSSGTTTSTLTTNECQLTLSVGRVQARAGCQIDERVSGQSAVLTYPCDGGAATAAFGTSVFTGSVTGGEVDVAIETTFPFSDGCQWRSKQRIAGRLGAPLAYTYEEAPEPGQGRCAPGCTASGLVEAR